MAEYTEHKALLEDFASALDSAVMGSGEAHQNQMMQYLNNKTVQDGFQRVVFEMLLNMKAENQRDSIR